MVEVLTAYSHTTEASDLQRCRLRMTPVPLPDTDRTTATPWNVRERLGDAGIQAIIDARRDGATLVCLTKTYGVSLSSVKRLIRLTRSTDFGPHKSAG
jgi:hypothetical protein